MYMSYNIRSRPTLHYIYLFVNYKIKNPRRSPRQAAWNGYAYYSLRKDSGKVAVFGVINLGCHEYFINSLIVNYSALQTQELGTEICSCIRWNTLKSWHIAGKNSSWNNESFRLWLLHRISYISTEQTQKRQELSVQCNDSAALFHIPSTVMNSVRLKTLNTKCVSLFSTVFFSRISLW
jgi:hypothetical protein